MHSSSVVVVVEGYPSAILLATTATAEDNGWYPFEGVIMLIKFYHT
jgi:hypothetical protein